MKVWILSKLFVDPLKFGSKNRYQSPETVRRFYFNSTKMNTKKVWILSFDSILSISIPNGTTLVT